MFTLPSDVSHVALLENQSFSTRCPLNLCLLAACKHVQLKTVNGMGHAAYGRAFSLTRARTRWKTHGCFFSAPLFRPRYSYHPFHPSLASQSRILLPRMGIAQQLARQRQATARYRCHWNGVLQCGLLHTQRQALRHAQSTLVFPEICGEREKALQTIANIT